MPDAQYWTALMPYAQHWALMMLAYGSSLMDYIDAYCTALSRILMPDAQHWASLIRIPTSLLHALLAWQGRIWVFSGIMCENARAKKFLLIFIRSSPCADVLAVMVGWTFKCVVLSMNLFTRYSNLNLLISSAGGENPQETTTRKHEAIIATLLYCVFGCINEYEKGGGEGWRLQPPQPLL